MCQRLVCQKREFAADRLPVKFQDVMFKDPKFYEIFMRIDMKHSYFPNDFIICLQSTFSVVETVCCLPKICSCLSIIFVLLNLK